MYLAGHSSNQECNVTIRETLADKIALAKRIKDSNVCKALSIETIAKLACKLQTYQFGRCINNSFRYKT